LRARVNVTPQESRPTTTRTFSNSRRRTGAREPHSAEDGGEGRSGRTQAGEDILKQAKAPGADFAALAKKLLRRRRLEGQRRRPRLLLKRGAWCRNSSRRPSRCSRDKSAIS
jgi:hypothetical protein